MKTMRITTRRTFIKRSAASTCGLALTFPSILKSETLGNSSRDAANSRVGIGFIGTGLIATQRHLKNFGANKTVQPIVVCDVKSEQIAEAQRVLQKKKHANVPGTQDYKEVLANPDVDAVVIATPDHWHVAIAIEAMQMGKDVYVEKPMSLTIEEGKALVAAEAKYQKIVQVGSQQRSTVYFRMAANLVRNGKIGELKEIDCRLGSFPWPPDQEEYSPVPDGFDYDRWLGPTPFYEYSNHRVLGDYSGGWRCYWDYGARKNGDWGAHHYDIVQWALGRDDTGPVEFIPAGHDGVPHHSYRYADGLTVWRDREPDAEHMIRFVGTEGEIRVSRDSIQTSTEELRRFRPGPNDITVYESKNHTKNFVSSVKNRKPTICPATIGHRSATICHLASIAERLKRPIKWDPEAEQILDDAEAASMQDRPRRAGYELPEIA
ncbi:MAG: Gfo/Idh/MocA family oxidoreductase [Verrucomicrobiota bacterium]